ncbi:spore germination protein [Cohnella faecalis]|uniref:Spore germination protein n=1 Tax=Cohnella faecalis TaxID=2315694 RepID=A0A398CXG4_9BACL|nr:spore germination protein [Cohnella faecalis]
MAACGQPNGNRRNGGFHLLNRLVAELNDPDDLCSETIDNGYWTMELVYFPALCDEAFIKDGLLVPFSYRFDPDEFRRMLKANPKFVKQDDRSDLKKHVLQGKVILSLEGTVYSFDAIRKLITKPDTAQVETALQGPYSALAEDLDINLYLIRSSYNDSSLAIEYRRLGDISNTRISLVYDKKLVNESVRKELDRRLSAADLKLVQAAGELGKKIAGSKRPLFPLTLVTERPDRITMLLKRGKIVIVIDGSRFALVLPVCFSDFMHAMDDEYEMFWMSRALLLLRYLSLFLTLTLPAAYISIVSYNPEIFRVQLTLSIAGSRLVVPYPSFIEVFIMLFMIEALTEASLRLPRYIGSTAATVGGLILGQAVQQAGLVSSIMIIVTSVVAISNFVIPNSTFSYAIRFAKYIFVAAAIFFGTVGVVVTFFMLVVYVSGLRSFGEPYLTLPLAKNKGFKQKAG